MSTDAYTEDSRRWQAECDRDEAAHNRGETALEIVRDHYRHSFSVEEYDALCAALIYLLERAPEKDCRHVAEILEP